MLKKVTSCLVFFIVLAFFAGTALADWPEYTGEMNDDFYVTLIDGDSGRVLYEKNEDERIAPASTTKIMTCMLAIENSNMDDTVTISGKAARTGGSNLGIKENEEIRMQDLLTGMMLVSGNDAAVAVAEKISGSVEDFAALMNEKAKSLGMDSTNFVNPNGLDDENHLTTASDMAKLACYAMQNETFRNIVKLEEYRMPETNKQNVRTVENTNWILDQKDHEEYYYEYATGIKTGSTKDAGGCLVSSATKGGMNLICLVFGEFPSSKKQRWTISKDLFEWGFDKFETIDVSALSEDPVQVQVQDYAVDDAKDGLLEFKQPDSGYVTLPKDAAQEIIDGTDSLEAVPAYDKELVAPVEEGDIFGTVIYKSKATGEEIYSYPLIASRDILEETAGDGTPVMTLPPTPPPDKVAEDYTLFVVVLVFLAGGLIAFLIIRMVMARRRRHFKRRRRPHYRYRK
jgi:D-alanyl-D-alanine carboxypeptidase (penicillin-binding protein 5/6)